MTPRPIRFLLVFLAVPLLAGCLIAPWVYLAIRHGAQLPILSGLAEDRFERVAARCVQVVALLLVWPCLRRSGTIARVAPALRWARARGRQFLRWAALGAGSVAVVYGGGFAAGLYRFDPAVWGTGRAVLLPLEILFGALLVGVLEEYLFRGFVFGSLRARLPPFAAAAASSALFALIHFLRPRLSEPPAEITWRSGFDLLPRLFALFRPALDWDFALTLFLMGLALCGLLLRHGHLYGIAGLHAGWVWALQSGNALVNQEPRAHYFWLGWGDNPSQGAAVTLLAAALATAAWGPIVGKRRCQAPPPSDRSCA